MIEKLPRSLIFVMASVAVFGFAGSVLLEDYGLTWLSRHPIMVNLISGAIGFASVTVFVAVVLNWYVERSQYSLISKNLEDIGIHVEACLKTMCDAIPRRWYQQGEKPGNKIQLLGSPNSASTEIGSHASKLDTSLSGRADTSDLTAGRTITGELKILNQVCVPELRRLLPMANSFAAIKAGHEVLQLNDCIGELELVDARVSRQDLLQLVRNAMRAASAVVGAFEGNPHMARLVYEREQELRRVRKRTEKLYRPKNWK